MRSVRRTLAWLPLWVLVLLAGGCSDEFGVLGLSSTVIYLLVPNSYEISSGVSKVELRDTWYDGDVEIKSVKDYQGYNTSEFKKEYESNSYTVYAFYGTYKKYGLPSRRNYHEKGVISVVGQKDGESFKEEIPYTIEIPYLNQGHNCQDLKLDSENIGSMYALYRYYFSRYM